MDVEHSANGPTGLQPEPAPETPLPLSVLEQQILSPQGTAGNAVVAQLLAGRDRREADRKPARLQRAIRIAKVDFNPDVALQLEGAQQPIDDGLTNFELRENELRTLKEHLTRYLRQNAPEDYPADNKPIGPQAARNEIRGRLPQLTVELEITGTDVPDLAAKLATRLRGPTALTEAEHRRLEAALQAAIGSVSFAMKQPSAGMFEQLLEHAGGGSRAKGAPTRIQHGQLPGELQGPVQAVATQIRTRNHELFARATRVMPEAPPPSERLSLAASEEMAFVRTVHTNASGWLPTVVAPAAARTFEAPVVASLPGKVRTKGSTRSSRSRASPTSRRRGRRLRSPPPRRRAPARTGGR